jgi:hypothetical protein
MALNLTALMASLLRVPGMTQGGYGTTSGVNSPASSYFPLPSDNSINVRPTGPSLFNTTAPAVGAGLSVDPQMNAPIKPSYGPVEFSSAQKFAMQKAEEERMRKEELNKWQEQWRQSQQIKDRELRDRLAEIRTQAQEQRKTQYEGFNQSSTLGKENKQMSAAEVYAQLMAALGGF